MFTILTIECVVVIANPERKELETDVATSPSVDVETTEEEFEIGGHFLDSRSSITRSFMIDNVSPTVFKASY